MSKFSLYTDPISRFIPFTDEFNTLVASGRYDVDPSLALKQLIDKTFRDIKSDGVLSKGDAMYYRSLHETKLSLQNWIKNSSNSELSSTPPTHTPKEGFSGNGASSYINTHFIPSSDAVHLTLTSASFMMCLLSLGTTTARNPFGAQNNGTTKKNFYMTAYTGGTKERMYMNSGTFNQNVELVAGDYIGFTRNGTSVQGYVNGVASGAPVTAATHTALVDYAIHELAYILDGTVSGFYNGKICFSWYGGYLTSDEMLALYTRAKYFQDHIGGTF